MTKTQIVKTDKEEITQKRPEHRIKREFVVNWIRIMNRHGVSFRDVI